MITRPATMIPGRVDGVGDGRSADDDKEQEKTSMNTAYNQMGASTPYFAREVVHHHISSGSITNQQRSFEMQGRDVPTMTIQREQLRARPQVPAPHAPVDGRRDQFGVVGLHRHHGAGVAA